MARRSVILVSTVSAVCAGTIAVAEVVVGMRAIPPRGVLPGKMQEAEEKLVILGASATFLIVTYAIAKRRYAWRSERERKEFHLAAEFGLATGWFGRPSLFISIPLLGIAAWEFYRGWRAERRALARNEIDPFC
jgi:hypothetical protein